MRPRSPHPAPAAGAGEPPTAGRSDPPEVWFHALVELATDAVLVIDPASGIRFANRAAERLFGYPPERLVGRPLTDLMPEELRGAHLEGFGRYLETGERRVRWEAVEVTVLDSAGERVPVEVSFTEIAQGGERLFAGVVRDIRPRKRAEAQYQEAARRGRLLQLLQEVSRPSLTEGEPHSLLERIVAFLADHFGFPVVQAVLIDEGGAGFTLRAVAGRSAGGGRVGQSWPLAGGGIVGRTLRTGRTQLVPDVGTDPDYVEVTSGVRSELVVPIRLQDRTLGALNFETHEPDTFSPETRVLLELLADQVAGAIHQAELNRRLAATRDLLARANRDLQMANRELETLARTDPLTGCANRRHFEEVLPLEWRRAARSEAPLCLLLVDVDYFKSLNDSRGHREGDRCLERVARALGVASGRAGDVVARYGGDEFALLLPGLDAAAAAELGERIRAAVEALRLPHGSPPAGPTVTVSVGAASRNPASGGSPEELFEAADRGLAMAKARGRNAVGRSGQLDQGG
jgi:diguanylate cyclase (GGDEF)-like protein/PAS domain S-box-containing protein